MSGYRLYKTAQEALESIWFYSFKTWGETQADKYIFELYDCFEQLATKALVWRKIPAGLCVPPDLDRQVYFSHHQHHYIFFRELDNEDVGIISLLHEKMDLPVRLAEDLQRIE